MKKIATSLFYALALLIGNAAYAQTADEVIDMYFETMGGKDKIASITSTKSTCTAKAQGMELPVVMVSKEPNLQRMDMNLQGKDITQFSFDGTTAWMTNFMTMEPEAMDEEQSKIMAAQSDFPDPFLGYAEKGYSIELTGDEEVEGVDCHILKLTRKPVMVAGKEEENASLFYLDKENGVIIKQVDFGLAGPTKGQKIETYMSDYEEVDGMYFAHTIVQKMNGAEVFSVSINKIELNTDIPDDYFKIPE